MARLFTDEHIPILLTEALRTRGHDVLTAQEAGLANQGIPDPAVLAHATADGRAVLTFDRRDSRRLHASAPTHAGIITSRDDPDIEALADRIHRAVSAVADLIGLLIRVTRSSP